MDDRHAQFLIAVGDLCSTAALAALEVALRTRDGASVLGIPGSLRPASDDDEVDDSGYARAFRIADHLIMLDDIVECTIRVPSGA